MGGWWVDGPVEGPTLHLYPPLVTANQPTDAINHLDARALGLLQKRAKLAGPARLAGLWGTRSGTNHAAESVMAMGVNQRMKAPRLACHPRLPGLASSDLLKIEIPLFLAGFYSSSRSTLWAFTTSAITLSEPSHCLSGCLVPQG
jgi:hypothetical protein